MARTARFTHCGKEVLSGGLHFADAVSVDAASLITDALNFFQASHFTSGNDACTEGLLELTDPAEPGGN